MAEPTQKFSGPEFLEKLVKEELTIESFLAGMVKAVEGDSSSLQCAPGTNCATWA